MRALFGITLAACLTAVAQTDPAVRLESLLAEAHEAQARNDYRSAAHAYQNAIAIRSDVAELWSNLGLMLYQSNEYSQAEQALRRALGINSSLFVPNLFLGLDLLELKRPREAIPFLLAAQKRNPQDTQALLALGRAYHVLSDPDQSRAWYERATESAARNGEAWYGVGLAYFDLAELAGSKLSSAFADSAYTRELIAEAFAEQGRLAEAIERFRALLAANEPVPQCARAAYGFALLRHGDREQAEEQFKQERQSCPDPNQAPSQTTLAASLNPPHEVARPAFAKMTDRDLEQFTADAFFAGDFQEAALAADRLRQHYPNHVAGWYWAVRADQKLGLAALVRAGEVEPDSRRIHALLGDAYQRRKMFPEAQAEYSKILALDPDNIAGLTGLALAYLHEGKLNEAQVAAGKALARDPDDSEINLVMGEILTAQHSYADAEHYLQHSLHARPDLLPRAHALLGRVYARTGKTKEAIAELRRGLASDEDGSVHYQLARLYQSSGDAKAAAAAFEKSERLRANRDVPVLLTK